MVNELLEMLSGGNDERQCCDGRDRQGGIRGFIARLLGGEDNDTDNHRDGECCSGATSEDDTRGSDHTNRRRDRDERNDDFDFGG